MAAGTTAKATLEANKAARDNLIVAKMSKDEENAANQAKAKDDAEQAKKKQDEEAAKKKAEDDANK